MNIKDKILNHIMDNVIDLDNFCVREPYADTVNSFVKKTGVKAVEVKETIVKTANDTKNTVKNKANKLAEMFTKKSVKVNGKEMPVNQNMPKQFKKGIK